MSKKSRSQINIESNFIRQYMEQNLELGKSHEDIIQQLGISRATFYRHVKRIMKQDEKVWDKITYAFCKVQAQRLVDSLLNCVNLCKQIMNDENAKNSERIEAAKTLCIAETNIYKIVEEGPTFRVSLPLYPNNNHQESISNNNDSTKQLPN